MRFHVLGGLVVTDGDTTVDLGTPKQRAVVAALLLERDQVVSSDRLVDLLWGDDTDKALSSLRTYVSRLRSALEPQRRPRDPSTVLVSQAPGYRLVVPRGDVDLYRFEDLVSEGRRSQREGDVPRAVATLDEALATWGGPLLPELADQPFVLAAATRAEELHLSALELYGEACLEADDPREAVSRLEAEAQANPARERLQAVVALAVYRCGRQADALRIVASCRRALVELHGLDPGPELVRLEADLLARSPSLDRAPNRAVRPRVVSGPTATLELRSGTLVGRAHEVAVLRGALERAIAGEGSTVVLIGEPGIGKSRLAEVTSAHAAVTGVATAWARCPESRGTPPFWVLTHLREALAEQLPPDTFTDVALPTAVEAQSAAREGFGLARAVLGQIASADVPILVVIDDLQWADPDSLRLVENVVADLASTKVLLLVTTRPPDSGAPDALVDCLAEIARVPTSRHLEVGALDVDDVARWLADVGGEDGETRLAAAVHERTGGNPLFVKELTALLEAEGRLDDADAVADPTVVPAGVRFVVRRRVSRLPPSTQQVLSTAAVLGSPFRVDTLAASVGAAAETVLADLAPALDDGLLVERHGEMSFSHALVGDALASEVNAARVSGIHARAARYLAERAGTGPSVDAAAIARHARIGLLAGTGDLAIEASRSAADLAMRRGAFEDAADHWADLAGTLLSLRPSDVQAAVGALVAQADALTQADRTEAAKGPILAAIDAAGAAGLTDAMVRAASLLNHPHVWTNEAYGVVDPRLIDALERTLDLVGDDDPATSAILLGALASELVFGDPVRHREVCAHAERAARASGDPVVLARTLNDLWLPAAPDQLGDRRRLAAEMLDLAAEHDLPPGLVYVAHHHVAEIHLEMGELAATSRALASAERALDSMPHSHLHQHLWMEAAIATATGRYEAADDLITRAYDLHRRGRLYDADALLLGARAAVAVDRGGLEELIPFAVTTADTSSYNRLAAEYVAFAMLELGRADLAEAQVGSFDGGVGFTDDYTTLAAVTAAAQVRIELDDLESAEPLVGLLRPYADRWAFAGSSPLCMGPVSLTLARFAAAMGEESEAQGHFASSVDKASSSGTPAWLARTLVHEAAFLAARGEMQAARNVASRARDIATRTGLPYVLRRMDAAER